MMPRTVIDDLANALEPRDATALPGRPEKVGGMGGHIGAPHQ